MKEYFVIAFISVSALLGMPDGAFARQASQMNKPALGAEPVYWRGETGTASYYGYGFNGRQSASGSRFDQDALTAAHPWLPFGTRVKVSLNPDGPSVIVTITDRMPRRGRIVDLSVAAARRLGMIDTGLAKVTLLPA